MQFNSDLILTISLLNLGFFGGFSHCAGMCGPFVLTQTSSILQNTKLENYRGFQKLKSIALLPYHFGRITTYSFIGFFCAFLGKNLKDFTNFGQISAFFLILAAFIMIGGLQKLPIRFKIKLPLQKLFANPTGFYGYFLGIILGFLPCGLLYGAFAISASFKNPLFALFSMFLFGISTIPALFLVSAGTNFVKKIDQKIFAKFCKIAMFINAFVLILMAINQF